MPGPFSDRNRGLVMTLPPRVSAVAAFLLAIAAAAPAKAGDVANGRKIALVKCQMCHGIDGEAKLPEAPNLAGQVELYLVKELEAFRSGERKNEMMSLVVPTLSENDVADIAAYYAAIEVKIGKVPGQ
jgi:cytochrome c553